MSSHTDFISNAPISAKVTTGAGVTWWNMPADFLPATLNGWVAVAVGLLTVLVLLQTLWKNWKKK